MTVRYCAHGQYGDERRAAAALRRRAPGRPPEDYAKTVAALVRLYEETVRVVQASPLPALSPFRPKDEPAVELAKEAAAADLSRTPAGADPAVADDPGRFVDWVYFWHVLK